MKKLLFPTDFSDNSLKALEFGLRKLADDGAELFVVHTFEIPQGGQSGLFYLLEEMQKQAEKDMAQFKTILEEKYARHNYKWHFITVQGMINREINQLADRHKVDAIVMGTKGATGLKKVLIGSNTTKLMNTLNRPLYAIPENIKDLAISEVLYAYDGKMPSRETAESLSWYARKYNLPINVVHVRKKDEDIIKDWSGVKAVFKGANLDFTEVHADSLEKGLDKLTNNKQVLLAMVRHEQSFWERLFNLSDSHKIMMHTQVPLLVVPEKA
jgi:nucleotide-binding universal stress UspA family protein